MKAFRLLGYVFIFIMLLTIPPLMVWASAAIVCDAFRLTGSFTAWAIAQLVWAFYIAWAALPILLKRLRR